jgi:hypothetical protein
MSFAENQVAFFERLFAPITKFSNWKKTHSGIVLLIFIGFIVFMMSFNYLRLRFMHFNGVVEDISYGQFGNNPEVEIHGERYNLYNAWGTNSLRVIQKGDQLIKVRNDMHLKIVEPGRKDTIDLYK